MAGSKKSDNSSRGKRPPATTPEARENQLIALAVDLAERQLLDGTASSQVITHYLKASSMRNKVEVLKLQKEAVLLDAKVREMEDRKRIDEMYSEALNAMRMYQGQDVDEDDYNG